ncbi:GNAT family N-acetyltransferase [Paenibacillus aceris]|uniref:Acetyltransferase n=1 Tax=Paenibacillus aceris TaxID=869555 RepID=A0ABS4HVX9_9BACL|nr:GNAT family N-acetyltransferase [Paenibacillus aceris]MBP1962675.1 putative acetyltransferase [Paenibacillus aceris]NHW37483.1 GNAT family N-acetyltransferase [Paenibacillus aceris]
MNEIRTLQPQEISESFALSQFAFQYELSAEEQAERSRLTDPKQIWGCFVQEKLAAKLHLLPFHTWLNGQRFAMGGIAGVATWPEYRRNGMVAKLLLQALKVMKEQGQTLSFLAPFKFEFYRKYGWETYIDYLKYEIPVDKLPKFQASEGSSIIRVTRNWELLNPIYVQHALRFNGMLERDADWWNNKYFKHKSGMVALYENAHGERTGYVFYHIKEYTATIHEMVFLDEDARRGLWKFIADHDSMITKVEVKAPLDDQLPFLVHDPKFKQEKITYFSARIVDVEAFLAQYVFATRKAAEPVYLRISDPHADWNNGVYCLNFTGSGEKAQVTKLAEGELPAEELLVNCSIQTLTALFMGYQKAGFLARIERLQGSQEPISRLEAAIPKRTTYLADFF